MPAVFVHGVPESSAIWSPMIGELDRDDIVTLSPPGFGAPVPGGWSPTWETYRDWLLDELAAIEAPIDLVGHDWGGGHVVNAMLADPPGVRSWVTDVIGLFHPDHTWHDMAQTWRTPEAGEVAIAEMLDQPRENRVAMFAMFGIEGEVGNALAEAATPQMGECILGLYRSADEAVIGSPDRGFERLAATPGLCMLATDDGFVGSHDSIEQMAATCGATVHRLEGLSHWWMAQDPAAGAAALQSFWAGVEG